MQTILQTIINSLDLVLLTFLHNWPFLIASILLAAAFKIYLKPEKISSFLLRHRRAGVVAATAVAVGTPLCSCGTTAIVLGMMAGMMPWAPIVTFMVASPLSSPEGMIYSAGLLGWPFAIVYFIASILLGLAAGGIAVILENRGWFRNQSRFSANAKVASSIASSTGPAAACGCGNAPDSQRSAPVCGCSESRQTPLPVAIATCGCGAQEITLSTGCDCAAQSSAGSPTLAGAWAAAAVKLQIPALLKEVLNTAVKLLPMFFGFAFIGFFLNGLIPSQWVELIFGSNKIYGVPLAATLGLPLYINSEASLPLAIGLVKSGMSQGAVMAFLLCGSGTSLGAITGALTIARWRVVALVVGILWLGAIVLGFAYDALVLTGLF